MTVSIRASLIFSALGMAALTAAFATPPASTPTETAIARCKGCQPAVPLGVSTLAPATPETKRLLPASSRNEACANGQLSCGKDRDDATPEPGLADPF